MNNALEIVDKLHSKLSEYYMTDPLLSITRNHHIYDVHKDEFFNTSLIEFEDLVAIKKKNEEIIELLYQWSKSADNHYEKLKVSQFLAMVHKLGPYPIPSTLAKLIMFEIFNHYQI